MESNKKQVGGKHYASDIQHWDYVVANDLNYFEGQITKYVTRARKKGGLQDLQKARHFLDKYIEIYHKVIFGEVIPPKMAKPQDVGEPTGRGYVDQDGRC
jgi:hypothetical protein